MDPKTTTRLLILKLLVESIAEDKRVKNLPAMEKLADRITDEVGSVLLPLLIGQIDGNYAPKRCRIRGLNDTEQE